MNEIKEILSLYDQHDGCETQNRVAVDKFRRRIAMLRQQRNEIDLQIKTLEDSCARLEAQIVEQVKAGKATEAAPKAAAKRTSTKKPEKAIV